MARRLLQFIAFLSILTFLFTGTTPPAAYATAPVTWHVNKLADTNDGSCTNVDCSLREAIAASSAGDTIDFTVTGTIPLSLSDLIINKSLTISGPGPGNLTIDAQSTSRAISTEGGASVAVSISGLTITNGRVDEVTYPPGGGYGGAIFNSDQLTLDNVVISDSVVTHISCSSGCTEHGGGIYSDGPLTITNSTLSNNTAWSMGGAIFFSDPTGSFSLDHVTVDSNHATGDPNAGTAAGVFLDKAASASISNSTISNNQSASIGAGLANDVTLTITNTTFSNNSAATNWGGAIANFLTLTISGSTFTNNHAAVGGGGIDNDGTVTVTDSVFDQNNTDPSGVGGALHQSGSGSATIKSSTLTNNTSQHGGAVAAYGGTTKLINDTFYGNNSSQSGGAVYGEGATLILANNTLSGNWSSTTGGAVYQYSTGSLSLKNDILANSTSGGDCVSLVALADDVGNLIETNDATHPCGATSLHSDPLLATLGDYGGPTQTMTPLTGSPAIDAGDTSACSDGNLANSLDQRGLARPQDAGCDIGAVEFVPGWIRVLMGGTVEGNHILHTSESTRQTYAGVNNGPVDLVNLIGVPAIASMRILLKTSPNYSSYTEFMGVPSSKLSDSYIFPWYNNASSSGLDSQLRFANVGNASTTVTVTIGGTPQGTYPLNANQSTRISYANLNDGPVLVTSSGNVPIVAAMRINLKTHPTYSSYTEFMGVSSNAAPATSFMFPWYNNATNSGLDTQLRFGNVGSSSTTVTVKVGGVVQGSYPLNASQSTRISYPNLNNGSVEVDSSGGVPIIASMRVNLKKSPAYASYSEFMGLSTTPDSSYVFPVYNDASASGLDTQLRFGNVGNAATTVTVTIAGVVQGTYPLSPSESTRVSYPGLNDGPVVVSSSGGVPIIAAMRVNMKKNVTFTSYAEFMGISMGSPVGLPGNELGSSYLFPWYNDASSSGLDSQLRFGLP